MDKSSTNILIDTYWSSSGWNKSEPSPEDFEYAKSKGVMFDPVSMSHDEIVKNAVKAIDSVNKDLVVKAFISSLTSRRLDLRSALASYASGIKLPQHTISADKDGYCLICSEFDSSEPFDLNVLNFERVKFGGVRHLEPVYIWLDLQLFTNENIPEPTSKDIDLLKKLIDEISYLREGSLSSVEKSLKLPRSNKDERRSLISTLGYCGILKVPDYPCFHEEYIENSKRDESRQIRSDWPFPTGLWTPQYGVNEKSVKFWFSDYL
ncbi:hypothetical protein EUZ85_16935 [Hahella sp. KA22]|uniref:hypothetical protein n=1 Tax=Hahella sp. KA22 TaxID=1628392 RepID=UPI000FDDCB14|nr:hypothetical protein [Hahella sp. KA22]AZZ92320.1 hypothetical protein ENC22_14365 [Hahella sp. KA22]QAY55692.1 hypothetical protein EUZ85_16935 [Hahella sp. KA22]